MSSSISVYFGTQIIGDANNLPTIVAAASFVGLGVLSTDVYVENGGIGPDGNALQWYINTARFYGQIRNIKIDIRATDPGAYVCALHYQVAQATTIENVELIADSATVCSIPITLLLAKDIPNIRYYRPSRDCLLRMEAAVSCQTSLSPAVTLAFVSLTSEQAACSFKALY